MTYKYSLSKSKTMPCPRCGKKRFKPYVAVDGQILDPRVGRCNREFNCGYHLSPRQFFHENPMEALRHQSSALNLPPSQLRRHTSVRALDFIPEEIVNRCRASHPEEVNPLRRWFLTMFPAEAVSEVFSLYRVGDAKRYGGSTIFWYIDPQNRVRSGKIMGYGPDGHRLKGDIPAVSFVHRSIKSDFNYALCYFGVHLLPQYPEAKVIVVESEKTALCLALWLRQRGAFPQGYIPVATGGCARFVIHPEMIDNPGLPGYHGNDIRNRHVIAIPDNDQVQQWRLLSAPWQQHNRSFRLFDISPYARDGGDDIADILLRRLLSGDAADSEEAGGDGRV